MFDQSISDDSFVVCCFVCGEKSLRATYCCNLSILFTQSSPVQYFCKLTMRTSRRSVRRSKTYENDNPSARQVQPRRRISFRETLPYCNLVSADNNHDGNDNSNHTIHLDIDELRTCVGDTPVPAAAAVSNILCLQKTDDNHDCPINSFTVRHPITKVMVQGTIYTRHIFIFCFRWLGIFFDPVLLCC